MAELEAIDDVKDLPGGFPDPATCTPFKQGEAQDIARSVAPSIVRILQEADEAELARLYHGDGFWRDQVSLAWTFRTFHSIEWVTTS